MTVVLPSKPSIETATKILQAGGIVAFPTETVYGLGCDTFNPEAIELIYKTKGRPIQNPMIAHILEPSWTERLTDSWNKTCNKLAEQFWPGPLAIVLPKKEEVPSTACGGRNTIAIRCPRHNVAQQLLGCFGNPISAPSANKSGYISPTTAKHVEEEFQHEVLVLDGGPCDGGIESTVLSLVDSPSILRPGAVTKNELEKVIGEISQSQETIQTDSPGTTRQHYSPNTSVILMQMNEINKINDNTSVVIVLHGKPLNSKQCIQMPRNAQEYGTQVYGVLREADGMGATEIAIEQPPNTIDWHAIQDRLARCAAKTKS